MTNSAALIDPHNSDNSAETKQVTYYGEIADFIQFMTMTTFSDGLNAVARYGFGNDNFIPVRGLVGMDIFSYSIMTVLAYYREEKFLQRHDFFVDKYSGDYYRNKSRALFAALNNEELAELERDRGRAEAQDYIIDLLKYNARAINPNNLPAAKTVLDKWRGIFAKAKSRPLYAQIHSKAAEQGNDLAFYRANMRGILQDELDRTAFKAKLFGAVKNVSAIATVYSVGSFVASFFFSLSVANIIAPIFLVGTSSLIDEWTDCNYKEKKLKESRQDLSSWMDNEENKKAYAVFHDLTIFNAGHISAFAENKTNYQAIRSYYLGVKKEIDEPFNLQIHGLGYLSAKAQEHKDLSDRLARREIKYKQACMSFTGVFFGVLISMAVGILAMTLGMGQATDILGFVGFATIFIAAVAGLTMIKYQNGQHSNKASQAASLPDTEIKSINTARPLFLGGYSGRPEPVDKQHNQATQQKMVYS